MLLEWWRWWMTPRAEQKKRCHCPNWWKDIWPRKRAWLSCAYYVTFPDSNLLTLETKFQTVLHRDSFCFSIRWLWKLSESFLWTLSEGKIQKNKPAFPWGTKWPQGFCTECFWAYLNPFDQVLLKSGWNFVLPLNEFHSESGMTTPRKWISFRHLLKATLVFALGKLFAC